MTNLADFQDILTEGYSLAEQTWLRVGGKADWLAVPRSQDELASLVERCQQEEVPVRLLGAGSNLLVRDAGVPGVVIRLSDPAFRKIETGTREVICGGGAELAHVVSKAVGAGLAGLEQLVGIPGTMGGALHGNAGSHGGDVGQWVQRATVLTRTGQRHVRERSDMIYAYRQSSLDELCILEVNFQLEEENPTALAKRMQKQWIISRASLPMAHENTGYLFKSPRGMHAEKLIEQAGLKGTAIGGAELSPRHTNFVVTHPGASSDDVEKLIDVVREGVLQKVGVELELQLEIW